MTQDIADIVKGYITSLGFVDKISGLSRSITFETQNENGQTIRKTIPIACNVTHADCLKGRYEDLIPDSKYKSLIYFEELNGARLVDNTPRDFSFEATLRLVCWLNLKKLGESDCSISSLALTNILNVLPGSYFNNGIYTRILIEIIGEVKKDKAIFGQYTYDDAKKQYLMYPFDFFALDLKVSFSVSRNCITPWSNSTETSCEDHLNQ